MRPLPPAWSLPNALAVLTGAALSGSALLLLRPALGLLVRFGG